MNTSKRNANMYRFFCKVLDVIEARAENGVTSAEDVETFVAIYPRYLEAKAAHEKAARKQPVKRKKINHYLVTWMTESGNGDNTKTSEEVSAPTRAEARRFIENKYPEAAGNITDVEDTYAAE